MLPFGWLKVECGTARGPGCPSECQGATAVENQLTVEGTTAKKKPTCRCHICGISVPQQFSKEHNQSKLHVTLLRLANEAAGRLNKYTQQQLNKTETCYCTPCNKEVESIEDHEKELKHQMMKRKEEDLLYVYTDEHQAYTDVTKLVEYSLESRIDNHVTSKKVPDIRQIIEETILAPDFIEIRTECGDWLVVPQYFYHGISFSKNLRNNSKSKINLMCCMLCKENGMTETEVQQHISNSMHQDGVKKLLFNKQGIRRVSKFGWSVGHCVVCNFIIYDAAIHVASVEHQHKMKISLAVIQRNCTVHSKDRDLRGKLILNAITEKQKSSERQMLRETSFAGTAQDVARFPAPRCQTVSKAGDTLLQNTTTRQALKQSNFVALKETVICQTIKRIPSVNLCKLQATRSQQTARRVHLHYSLTPTHSTRKLADTTKFTDTRQIPKPKLADTTLVTTSSLTPIQSPKLTDTNQVTDISQTPTQSKATDITQVLATYQIPTQSKSKVTDITQVIASSQRPTESQSKHADTRQLTDTSHTPTQFKVTDITQVTASSRR